MPLRAAEIADAIEAMVDGGMTRERQRRRAALNAKDFRTDQEVRWCPGCGDYAILAAMQSFMPELGIERERTVFVRASAARRGFRIT